MFEDIKFIDGGITAAKGFSANGILCNIKKGRTTNDTALIFSEKLCNAAALFTKNKVKAECVKLSMKNIQDGKIQAIIANSGNANCCTGTEGYENALRMAKSVEKHAGICASNVFVCSTGVIGQQLDVKKIEDKMQDLYNGLSKEGHTQARIAIMTTDTCYKECAVEFFIKDKVCRIGAMCKGSGMIHINLGTMLSFITTDCAISSDMLKKALYESAESTYNCVSIDGDTSTNDTLVILANSMAENEPITEDCEDFKIFMKALNTLNSIMAKKIAADGEGATRLIECNVKGAKSVKEARILAKQIISSSLVKAAMFGCDANFGRFLCAMGYSGVDFTPETTSIWFSSNDEAKRYFDETKPFQVHGKNLIQVYKDGVPLNFDENLAKKILNAEAVEILVQCKDGEAQGTAWGCDLTYDYVKINGDYRT